MANLAPAAENRPLRIRRRPDIQMISQQLGSQRLWTFKDPVSLKYFHFSDEERYLFDQLDGHTSTEELQHNFEARFAPQRISFAQLHSFLGNLHREGLVLGDTAGQSQVLLERKRKQIRRQRWARLLSVLAIRFRGVDAQPFLDWLYPAFRWVFRPQTLLLFAAVIIAAVVHVGLQWRQVSLALPDFEQFLGGSNLLWLAITIAGVKVLHELAHGLTLKHFGGECHEIGPMLLLLTPCLYCNTTDAWMLPSKWQRAAVSAAGIFLELLLAAIASFLWWWTEAGIIHSLCMNIMILCSVNTVFFNGNPLLHYDGYYVLADLCEIPNLGQQAADTTQGALLNWFLGLKAVPDRLYRRREHRGRLVAYHCASMAYRVIVVSTILWGLSQLLAPHRLGILAAGLAVVVVGGMFFAPLVRVYRFVQDPRWRDQIRWRRFSRRGAIAAALVLAVLFTPIPSTVKAPAVVRYADADRIYVVVPGNVIRIKRPGDRVKAGEEIAVLSNTEIELAAERALGERNLQRVRLQNLQQQAIASVDAANQIPAAKAALEDLENRLAERMADVKRLKIVAPRDGTILSPPNVDPPPASALDLPDWQGSPLDEQNINAYLKTGTLLCLIGSPSSMEAVALVNQKDIELVRTPVEATIALNLYPAKLIHGTLEEISPSRVDELPRELWGDAELPQKETAQGILIPLDKIYQARVRLDQGPTRLLDGATGTTKIHTPARSIANRFLRFLQGTFRVDWPGGV